MNKGRFQSYKTLLVNFACLFELLTLDKVILDRGLPLIKGMLSIKTWASTGIFSEGEYLRGKFVIDGMGTNEGAENKNRTAKSVNILTGLKY